MKSLHRDVVVVGGGQAGLAVGHHLARQGRTFSILEAGPRPATAWRERWDSLRLFTPARFDGLPGRPFPGDPDHYPTRDEVVDYLTAYAADLPVEVDSRVRSVRSAGEGFLVALDDRVYEAGQVVVATGPFQTPRVPAIATRLSPEVTQLHSAAYRNPAQIPRGPVLVVGGGNTGHQIAEELTAGHEVHLAVGTRQKPMPQRVLGRDVFSILDRLGAMTKTADTRIGRRLKEGETLVGSSPRGARRLGIRLHGRAEAVDGGTVRFQDGDEVTPRTVIWATGYGIDHSWIDVPVFDAEGHVVQERGVTEVPGFYFLGLPWMHSRGSALLGWVKYDAEHVAAAIARHRPASGILPQAA